MKVDIGGKTLGDVVLVPSNKEGFEDGEIIRIQELSVREAWTEGGWVVYVSVEGQNVWWPETGMYETTMRGEVWQAIAKVPQCRRCLQYAHPNEVVKGECEDCRTYHEDCPTPECPGVLVEWESSEMGYSVGGAKCPHCNHEERWNEDGIRTTNPAQRA